jgi:hypothetical protein
MTAENTKERDFCGTVKQDGLPQSLTLVSDAAQNLNYHFVEFELYDLERLETSISDLGRHVKFKWICILTFRM